MSQLFSTRELEGKQQWVEYTVNLLTQSAIKHIAASRRLNIAVSGGTTPGAIFRGWIDDREMESLWHMVWVYWVDERMVPTNHAESNYGNAFSILNKVPCNLKPMYNGVDDAAEAVRKYESELDEIGKINDIPAFDLVVLGMGDDGHTASLFPDSPALTEEEKWMVANPVQKLDATRLTLTYPILMNAKAVIILFNGDKKRKLLSEMMTAKTGYPIEKLEERSKPPQWIYY